MAIGSVCVCVSAYVCGGGCLIERENETKTVKQKRERRTWGLETKIIVYGWTGEGIMTTQRNCFIFKKKFFETTFSLEE